VQTDQPGPRSGSPEPTDVAHAAGAGDPPDQQLVTIITGGLIAIGALTMLGIFALLRERHRRATETRLRLLPDSSITTQAGGTEAATPPPPLASRGTTWERDYALDEQPIGTVEYRPPPRPGEDIG
jgi:hypothetical protein